MGVLSYVVARYTANRKVYLTTISGGRSNVKFSDTFGMFVDTLPLAADLQDISVDNFLETVSDMFAATNKVYHFYHEGFEEQAIKNPDKIALIAADCSLTYKELNQNANKIANALIERGIKPKSRVALLFPRTSRAILSIFGVLNAYIPCDTEYPAERINQIIDVSNAAYIITTSDRISGEKYPEKLITKLKSITKVHIINTYDPTETTISASMKDLTCANTISVGRPLLNKSSKLRVSNTFTPILPQKI